MGEFKGQTKTTETLYELAVDSFGSSSSSGDFVVFRPWYLFPSGRVPATRGRGSFELHQVVVHPLLGV